MNAQTSTCKSYCLGAMVALTFLYASMANAQPASRDPSKNLTVNPHANSAISPLNNAAINPQVNASINPQKNTTINPQANADLSPRRNTAINPQVNASLNPNKNASINPQISQDQQGLYLWNRRGHLIGTMVMVNSDFFLYFSGGRWRSYTVSNGAGGYNQFTLDGAWIGYFVGNSEGGFNQFDVYGRWIGFTT